MKQFNLEEFKKNPSQKVVLRSGSDVRIICTDKKGEFPIVALVEDDEQGEFTICYRKTGRFLIERESPNDLVFAPTKQEGWINIYKGITEKTSSYAGQTIYKSKNEALKNKDEDNYITTTKIKWKE